MTPEAIADWALHVTDSPLYLHLSKVIAEDSDLMRVLDGVANTPPLNILFAAVQMILAREPGDPLAAYYPSLTDPPKPMDDDLGRHFRRFVLEPNRLIIRRLFGGCIFLLLQPAWVASCVERQAEHLHHSISVLGAQISRDRVAAVVEVVAPVPA